jgi:hypothetical protein
LRKVNILGRKLPVPANRFVRIGMGVLFVILGIFGFLPILGFWMIPVGLTILSVDFPPVRRFKRWATVKIVNWFRNRWPSAAQRMGIMMRKRPLD